MPPGEEETGGRPRGGRAEGGAPNPGGGFEGQRGREVGSVGGEGGGAGTRGWGPGRRERASGGREGDGRRGGSARSTRPVPSVRSFIFLHSASKIFPASSSLSFQPGPGAPDAASQLLLLARAAKQLQNFPQNFTAWRDLGCCEAWPAEDRGARLTQVARLGPPAPSPSCFFCLYLAANPSCFLS